MNPSAESLRAYSEAVEAFNIWSLTDKRMPHDGGTDDQEAEWLEQIQAVNAASEEVEYIERKKEEDRMRKEQQNSGKK